ncbi:MAG: sirohydrochlorin chelatase, partial [Pseudomonadota bacterium]|nr:sirohydrochlorin chelatase [Pseudomonadota bacterium]
IVAGTNVMNCQMCKYREQILGFEDEVGLAQASHHHHSEGIGTDADHVHNHSHDHNHSDDHGHHPYPHADHPHGPVTLPPDIPGD